MTRRTEKLRGVIAQELREVVREQQVAGNELDDGCHPTGMHHGIQDQQRDELQCAAQEVDHASIMLRQRADDALLERGSAQAVLDDAARKLAEFKRLMPSERHVVLSRARNGQTESCGSSHAIHGAALTSNQTSVLYDTASGGSSPICDKCLQPISPEQAIESLSQLKRTYLEAAENLSKAEDTAVRCVQEAEAAAARRASLHDSLRESRAQAALDMQRAQHARDVEERGAQQRARELRELDTELKNVSLLLNGVHQELGDGLLDSGVPNFKGSHDDNEMLAESTEETWAGIGQEDVGAAVTAGSIHIKQNGLSICQEARLHLSALAGSSLLAHTNPFGARVIELAGQVERENAQVETLRMQVADMESKLQHLKPVSGRWDECILLTDSVYCTIRWLRTL